jgi:hypothetical protein
MPLDSSRCNNVLYIISRLPLVSTIYILTCSVSTGKHRLNEIFENLGRSGDAFSHFQGEVRQLGDLISHVLVRRARLVSLWRGPRMYIGNVRVIVFCPLQKIAAFLDSGRFFCIAIVCRASMPETVVSPQSGPYPTAHLRMRMSHSVRHSFTVDSALVGRRHFSLK